MVSHFQKTMIPSPAGSVCKPVGILSEFQKTNFVHGGLPGLVGLPARISGVHRKGVGMWSEFDL